MAAVAPGIDGAGLGLEEELVVCIAIS